MTYQNSLKAVQKYTEALKNIRSVCMEETYCLDGALLGPVDNCPTSPIFPTSCGLTAGPMDAAVKPRHVGGGGKCQHTLDSAFDKLLVLDYMLARNEHVITYLNQLEHVENQQAKLLLEKLLNSVNFHGPLEPQKLIDTIAIEMQRLDGKPSKAARAELRGHAAEETFYTVAAGIAAVGFLLAYTALFILIATEAATAPLALGLTLLAVATFVVAVVASTAVHEARAAQEKILADAASTKPEPSSFKNEGSYQRTYHVDKTRTVTLENGIKKTNTEHFEAKWCALKSDLYRHFFWQNEGLSLAVTAEYEALPREVAA